jgi:hypothetical protein
MKKISKINQLVLRGLLAEDEKLFLDRLAMIIDRGRQDVLQQIADGVITGVSIIDNDAAISWLSDRNKGNGWTITEITGIEPTSDGDSVRISYKYSGKVRWFTNQEDADRYSRGYSSNNSVEVMDEEHQFKGQYSSSSSDSVRIDKDWLKVEML